MTRGRFFLIFVGIGALSMGVAAVQQPAARAVLPDLQKVKDNLYIIASSNPTDRSQFTGGNTVVFITDSGVTVVDTKLAGYGPDILAKIRAVTSKPVTRIINTHTHGDHTGSNEAFPATVDIVAHENTKTNMSKMDAFKGANAQFLPKRTFKDTMTIGSGKDRIDLYYFGAGHTSGDTFVVFPALRVLQTGDMFAWKDAPLLDRNNGGSGVEFPKTLAKALAAIKDFDTVIPGHSPVMAPKDLQEYQRFTADLLAGATAAKKAGTSAADAAKAMNLAAKYPGYASDRMQAAVEAIYAELP
ncbi:MAG: MBL fold metallo-hydrolase [Acidobacteriaceae bacterium]|jgi:glyoxylase-like metal-dependent hydrolase (beta-lactamase superfamily II)|nr:MBL fold metallo-hydrolase [Acidobacteriaceae bacterium]